ncbi:ankyrin [Trametes cingulata]|nr:ankyrin [Trametes cingulata]
MPQTVEAQAFLARIAQVPSGPGATETLIQALQPSLDDEATLRKLFATDRGNARLQDPYVGLVDVFDAPADIRTTRARIVANEDDLTAHYILPLNEKQRRKEGEPAMVSSLDEFKKNWAIFSEGSLSQLTDWSNVVAAGGSVQACLAPVPGSAKTSKRAMRKYFHNSAFPTSDVDLFLYGLTPEQAEAKMQAIYEAVRDSVPWDVTCVRTKHTVSIHSQYPYRSVQIVLRLYASPAEILAGFDVDAPCCLYDGERVWANPRAIVAMMRQCNTVDMSRRSPSYEVRLTKYAARGFEVHVPTLRREDIDPTIFERSIVRVQGLARLLVLERLRDADTRTRYLTDRRNLRTRPEAEINWSRHKKRVKGDLKADADIGGLEMNDYDVQSLHIPYGPGWDARRIDKLVYQTDLGMNSPFNPKNKDRRLHRHPAFFGTMVECLEDCCEYCPEPKDEEEKKLQETEDESYVRGRVQFIREDPGRQSMSGSFNPIDEGEWAEHAYMGPTEKLFDAIVSEDRTALAKILSEDGIDVDRRDHVGRTPLQVAILSKAVDIACDLVDAGARMTSRLVDGRTALHLAAQLDLPVVVRKLLERSAVNAEKAKEEEAAAKQAKESEAMDVDDDGSADESENDEDAADEERDSSEDDWSSGDEEGKDKKRKGDQGQKPDASQIPEDEKDVPDVFDVNLPDWDYAFTPLQYAVVFGSLGAIDELLAAGANPKLVTKADGYSAQPLHPLTLTVLTQDGRVASEAAKKLFASGATSSEADDNLFTIFHKVVCAEKPLLVGAFLRHDPNAKTVLDSPHMPQNSQATFPIVSAIGRRDFVTMSVLLAHGAKIAFTEEDWSRARELRKNAWTPANTSWRLMVDTPVEVSLAHLSEAVELLVNAGADYNVGIRRSYYEHGGPKWHKTILDYVRSVIPAIERIVDALATRVDDELNRTKYRGLATSPGWKGARGAQLLRVAELGHRYEYLTKQYAEQRERFLRALEYFRKAEELLVSRRAKTWKELYPDSEADPDPASFFRPALPDLYDYQSPTAYYKFSRQWGFTEVPSHLVALYDELFEACVAGDKAKIEELCLPKDAKSKGDGKLLQIACRFGNDWGLTPLSLALYQRHWDAARLVLAIAIAQYKKKTEKPAKFVLTKNLALEDDDSEDGSQCESDEEMGNDDQGEVNFVDIAHRPSQVETDVPPARLLTLDDGYECPKEKTLVVGPPLFKAVVDDDFEAFVQILDLYKSLPEPLEIPSSAVNWVVMYDRPTMLDELIRRTGSGIELPEAHDEDEESNESKPKALPPKTYLGLNVHGKKRRDLVQKADPNAPGTTRRFDTSLLWTAARAGAVGIVQYLATERPVAAYDYYASTHSDDKAQYIRSIQNQIPQRLGWSSNDLNESVVTASVIGDSVDLLEAVVALQPASMQSALMSRIHYVGFNHILVAANWGCSPQMFDYLLSKGVSPLDTDVRGWNVYHLLCAHNSDKHLRLLKHMILKLPKDVTARLLLQQSKGALNTPLHIAIKRASLSGVQALLQVRAPALALRDQSGSTPLHVAIRSGLAEIAQLVGEAGSAELLLLEDGVGNTPLEIATQKWLQQALSSGLSTNLPQLHSFTEDLHYNYYKPRKVVQKDVKLLRDTIDMLLASGRLRNGTKLATELAALANKLETELHARAEAEAKGLKPAELDSDLKVAQDQSDSTKTLSYISRAVAANPTRRGLVHLIDVHRSVKGSLERSAKRPEHPYQKADDEGLDAEVAEDRDEKAKNHSAIAQWHSTMVMPLFGEDPF